MLSNKLRLRVVASIGLGICLLLLGQAAPIQASTYYVIFGLPTIPPSVCDLTGNYVQGPVSLNAAQNMSWTIVGTLNGAVAISGGATYLSASSGTGNYAWQIISNMGSYPYTFVWTFTLKAVNGTPLTRSIISFTCVAPGVITNLTVTNIDLTLTALSERGCTNEDNRLNRVCDSPWQTAAVYCNVPNPGDVRVYAVFDSKGYLAYTVSKAQLEAIPTKPTKNTLIAQNLGVRLYRLTSGALQINSRPLVAGQDDYVFIWDGC